jgi:hypothetical protein
VSSAHLQHGEQPIDDETEWGRASSFGPLKQRHRSRLASRQLGHFTLIQSHQLPSAVGFVSLLRNDALKPHAIRGLEERGAIGERFCVPEPRISNLGHEPFQALLAVQGKRPQIFAIEIRRSKARTHSGRHRAS